MNLIPGASAIGWGFNIFGRYSDKSLTARLFELPGGTVWQDRVTGTDYRLPGNVTPHTQENNSAGSQVFKTRVKAQEFFAAKAGVELSYVTEFGAFSGAFNASYEVASDQDSEFQYAVYQADNLAWDLTLDSQSFDQLTPEVQREMAALPSTFSPAARAAFFSFFDKYGTHFVSHVFVGGRLYYYVAVAKSYVTNVEKINTDVTLEYNALLVSGKAEAKTEWASLTKAWTENRTVRIEAIGGDPESLLLAAPEYDDNRSAIYKRWVDGIKNVPVAVDFKMRPINLLFPASQAEAAEQAFQAYFRDNLLFVEARSSVVPYPEPQNPTDLPVVILGDNIRPDAKPKHDFGFQLVVMQPANDAYTIKLNNYYSIDLYADTSNGTGYYAIYAQMMADLKSGGYLGPGYIVVLASFDWYWQAPPSSEFYAFLRSAGAGAKLEQWMRVSQKGSINSQDSLYILVGATGSGPGTGAEALLKAPIQGGPLVAHVAVRLNGLDIHRVNPPVALAATAAA